MYDEPFLTQEVMCKQEALGKKNIYKEPINPQLRAEAGEAKSSGNTKAFVRSTCNLTSIIMDEVRRFMKFTIAQAKTVLSR